MAAKKPAKKATKKAQAADYQFDRKRGISQSSARDKAMDRRRGVK